MPYQDKFLDVSYALSEAVTPSEGRFVLFNKEAFLDSGGTEEQWRLAPEVQDYKDTLAKYRKIRESVKKRRLRITKTKES